MIGALLAGLAGRSAAREAAQGIEETVSSIKEKTTSLLSSSLVATKKGDSFAETLKHIGEDFKKEVAGVQTEFMSKDELAIQFNRLKEAYERDTGMPPPV
jgi:hypothetical protein